MIFYYFWFIFGNCDQILGCVGDFNELVSRIGTPNNENKKPEKL